jgi:putative redox protein
MKLSLERINENVHFRGTNEGGLSIDMDGNESIGGLDQGPSPMEVVALGLAGCASIDMVHILQNKQNHSFKDYKVELECERVETDPKVFTKITMHFIINADIPANKVLRAAHLSHDKYCSVSMMLRKAMEIEYTVTLNGVLLQK